MQDTTHKMMAATLLLAAGSLAGCASMPMAGGGHAVDREVDELAQMMTGWFDSADQAAADPDSFFNIRLVMTPIWHDRTDGRWLYVEQAADSALDRPYRQRVYRLHRESNGRLLSDVYAFSEEPLDYAGGWEQPHLFEAIDPSDLTLREGCAIQLDRIGPQRYTGATDGQGCSSTLRGAAYATSEVEIEPNRLTSWDRGWAANGEQAWGSVNGAYIFLKRRATPPPRPSTAPPSTPAD